MRASNVNFDLNEKSDTRFPAFISCITCLFQISGLDVEF